MGPAASLPPRIGARSAQLPIVIPAWPIRRCNNCVKPIGIRCTLICGSRVTRADAAADLTQGFFADLLERKDIHRVQPELGKFRSFLLASLKHFVINEWDRQRAQKRGGGKQPLSIDLREADSRYSNEPGHENTPDRVYETQWAMTLLQRTRSALRKEMERRGRAHRFDELQVFLGGKTDEAVLADVAQKLGMTEVAAKVAVHRMRQRFGELLRDEIRQTVDDPADVDAEIQDLFAALRG